MRAWTIQSPAVLAALQSGRVWRAGERRDTGQWRVAYRWMAREMSARLGEPAAPGQMPVWIWCRWRGTAQPKPDLRSARHLPRGTPGVRIELELDDRRVLQSDFELWHYVLNGWHLPASLDDERGFDAAPAAASIPPSWQRIFDLDWNDPRYVAPESNRPVQGVVWELRPGDVRRATGFIAR
jgi:hypothetical protein